MTARSTSKSKHGSFKAQNGEAPQEERVKPVRLDKHKRAKSKTASIEAVQTKAARHENYGEWLLSRWGSIDPDIDLEF